MNALTTLFFELVSIPSPSGNELEVGKYIKEHLQKIGIESEFDNTGKSNQSNSGNLVAKLEGNPELPAIMFVAHMDTVEQEGQPITPKIDGNVIRSQGNTILGADDKAAIACLMQTLGEIKSWENYPTIISVFSTREENGQFGTSLLNLSEKIDFVFNLDGPYDLGDFINQTLGDVAFEIKLKGKAVHAAIEPEKGINAIKAASSFINRLKIGKDEKGRVLNIGKINGGKTNNIVPDEVILTGQVRAYEQIDIDRMLNDVEESLKKVCQDSGCSFEYIKKPEEGAPPASVSENSKIVQIAKSATNALKLPFSLGKGSYTSDANHLAKKYNVLTVCRGSKMPHSFEESMNIDDLVGLKNLILELAKSSMIDAI